ncbi:conserved hypothetical protein [Histoplasma capsulatum var. duboisii H88]|uniref:Mediator of RNA polymerase II transcription subunit 4 n=1 Tax=Ajellomyces capsulatus (strain H88) TaxID=544711 RepID=F0UWA0_AJEC8|nr:conserved hypothetical protein [Histoplasma capsulatum var. duboisii H88]
MDSQLLTPLSTLETRLNNLLMSMVSSPTAAGAPEAALSLLEADDAVSSALKTLHTHQSNYAKILRLRAEALALEQRVRDIVREVENVGNEISTACQQGVGASDDGSSDTDSETETEGEDPDTQMGGVSACSPRGFSGVRKGKGKATNEIDYKLLVNLRAGLVGITVMQPRMLLLALPGKQCRQKGTRKVNNSEQVLMKTTGKMLGEWVRAGSGWPRALELPRCLKRRCPGWTKRRTGRVICHAKESEGVDVEKELERLIRASEGTGAAGGDDEDNDAGGGHAMAADGMAIGREHIPVPGHGHAGGSIGQADTVMGGVSAPKEKPKAVLDLDLYDPDEDD